MTFVHRGVQSHTMLLVHQVLLSPRFWESPGARVGLIRYWNEKFYTDLQFLRWSRLFEQKGFSIKVSRLFTWISASGALPVFAEVPALPCTLGRNSLGRLRSPWEVIY